ncbi:GGDEF domain-containing protein [Aquisalimonas lutea]|uniref:putative bifunctional diguanylate cyclase/phosphodiesterase n=1 Tax=Aquisalimonas lutea TaxID=1327750 RepID=UPI0025B2F3CB|nr:GGDEF domain-containing protein [Aquisalimonas lutea]MDN3516495.1 GGDEF domain-containing protein [Aquisalimonas lutea]
MHDASRASGMGSPDQSNRDTASGTDFDADELDALLADTSERVLVVDAAGHIRKYRPGDDAPAPATDTAVPLADRQQLVDAIATCLQHGTPGQVDYRVQHAAGQRRMTARLRRIDADRALMTIGEAANHGSAQAALATRYAVERLIGRVSGEFINVAPDRIDAAVDAALAQAARYCGADRAYLYELAEGHQQLLYTHGWRRKGASQGGRPLQRLAVQDIPWFMDALRQGRTLRIDDPDSLPGAADAEKRMLADRQVQSALLVPVVYSGQLQGMLGFDTVREPLQWPADTLHLAGRVGELMASALQRKLSEQRIFRLAYYDQLTGLPNRLLLRSHLHTLLRHRRRPFALVLIDLDDASTLNDLMGHDVGDLLLQSISARLQELVGDGEILARWGGDAFMLTLPLEEDEREHTAAALAAIRRALTAPVRVDHSELRVSCCMGMARHPRDTSSVDEMIRFAELALGQAKQQGRDSLVVFTTEMQQRAAQRSRMEHRLRRAVETEAFDLHYQPQVCMRSGRLLGVEALIRWHDAELGHVAPDRFIELAEDTGLILPIGEWLARRACAELARWHHQGLDVPQVAINISGQQLLGDHLPAVLEEELRRHRLAPGALELEITESALMDRDDGAVALLHQLRALGVGIAVDDFGTGYSSLSQIKHLPVSKLKIDRSFIQDLLRDADDRAIVTAIIAMAHQLGLPVVAEGVESREQLRFLQEQGCDMVQGHLHGAADTAAVLEQRLRDAAGEKCS